MAEEKNKKKTEEIDDKIGRERGKLGEDALVKKKSKKQRIDSETEDDGKKLKKTNKEKRIDSEKSKKKKKKSKKESGVDEIGNSERSKVCDDANKKKGKRKRDETDLGAEENSEDDSTKDANKEKKKKKKKKNKQSLDSEVKETSLNSTEENKPSEDSEVEENIKDSKKDANKDKKKKAKQSVVLEVEDIKLKSTDNAKKKSKEKKPSADSEAEENDLNSTNDSKKKRKQSKVSEVEENNKDPTKDAKKKSKEKKRNQDSVADDSRKDAKKKRKKKQECGKSDKDVTTPSSKRVKFSDQVEIFPAEDEESEEEEVKLVRGKRYSKEEDELIKGSVLEYIENHTLGDGGIKMVMECKSHPQVKGCWKEIASAIPWRTLDSVYNRAHTIFEAGSRGVWTKEDFELLIEFQKKHGNDWRALADAMGKHRKHVKDAWRRIRLASKKKGHWTREEYQALFDLVNKDLRMKAFQEKHSKHGMLRDNIPWMAISDKLGSRDHVMCCGKWYDQLQSPMIAKGIWANVDDYRLLEELLKLDSACIDDVDWDNLLDNRDGEACRKRWNQMVLHIGSPRSKTFTEQVEILSDRYCPDLAEDREDFDNRPYDPED